VADLERSYPKDLVARVRAVWPTDARPLPRRLEALLGAAYHASFLRDEERPVTMRMLVVPPGALSADGGPPGSLLPLVFETPRGFDEHELRRLSPAASFHRALIGIDDSDGELRTWGLAQSGPRWLQAARGGRAQEPPMPAALVVRVVRPGHVVVACGSRRVAELRGGRLSDFALDVFQSQWLPELFRIDRSAWATEDAAAAGNVVSDVAVLLLTRHAAQQMIKRVIATMQAAHHGGTLVMGPPDCVAERYMRTKYPLRDTPARRRFRALVQSIVATLAERAAATGGHLDPDFYRIDTDPRIAEFDEALFEMSHLIASLANVDGAVVLTKRLEIMGFGAEIGGALPPITQVRRALDLEAETFVTEVVDVVGTRHRSAYRFCAAVPESVAVVVSQDGGVRFVNCHRGVVTYWDHGIGDD
jgi:hypothetical protein